MSSSSDDSVTGAAQTVDCDLWVQKANLALIAPYLQASWRDWLRIGEQIPTGGSTELPEGQYFVPGSGLRRGQAADDPPGEARAYLDSSGLRGAVFNPGAATSIAGLGSPLLATEVARAVNQWTADRWLASDPRLLGSIVVALADPRGAAQEIRRASSEERMVQIVIAYPPRMLGDHWFHPIYEAAVETGLPVLLQSGGDYSGANGGLTAVGNPATPLEAFVGWEAAAIPQLASLIVSGVFDRFPDLRVVFSGFGVAWLPAITWRLDTEYKAGRVRVPASLARKPSEYLPDHIRLTTSVLELPPDGKDLESLLALVAAERLLVLGSGPLRGEGPPGLDALPHSWHGHVGRNSDELYPITADAASA